jgi:hypothetical protein
VLVIAPAFNRLPIAKKFALTAAHFGQMHVTVRWLSAVFMRRPDTNLSYILCRQRVTIHHIQLR